MTSSVPVAVGELSEMVVEALLDGVGPPSVGNETQQIVAHILRHPAGRVDVQERISGFVVTVRSRIRPVRGVRTELANSTASLRTMVAAKVGASSPTEGFGNGGRLGSA